MRTLKSKKPCNKCFHTGFASGRFKDCCRKQRRSSSISKRDNLKQIIEKLLDNPNDITDTKYGNANVMGPDKEEILHGTHVAGIVAQVRGNNLGGDGVANNVQILTVRAA
jgi:hypothetical protein